MVGKAHLSLALGTSLSKARVSEVHRECFDMKRCHGSDRVCVCVWTNNPRTGDFCIESRAPSEQFRISALRIEQTKVQSIVDSSLQWLRSGS